MVTGSDQPVSERSWSRLTDVLVRQLMCETNPLRLMLNGTAVNYGMLKLL